MRPALGIAALLFALPASAADIEWLYVGAAGNRGDTHPANCGTNRNQRCGGVPYDYWISKYEITNAQYAAFLNAIAASDPNGAYNPAMGDDPSGVFGGIARSGEDGSYTYDVKPGFDDKPVVFVSFYDALRFANWLHHGAPTGPQDALTTEDGAYTISPEGVAANDITRNEGALASLTSENEWYKAAYYDEVLDLYYDYPAGTDVRTTCAPPGAIPNTANCDDVAGGFRLTPVGVYTASPSPYGTFDQGGNLWEWNETILPGKDRALRGGNWDKPDTQLWSRAFETSDPLAENADIGFRVTSAVPEPSRSLLLLVGAAVLEGARRRHACSRRRPTRDRLDP
jgi:formylglycine-generating enzyme required for sulfatase activity